MGSGAASSGLPGSAQPAWECVGAADTCNYARRWKHSYSETTNSRANASLTETPSIFLKYPAFLQDFKAPFGAPDAALNSPMLQQI